MGRILINHHWHVKFYENKNKEGSPIKEYKCKDLKEVREKTGMSRSNIHKIRTGDVKKSYYEIELRENQF